MLPAETDRSWLVPLADMSLLLFIVTASALRLDPPSDAATREQVTEPALAAAAEIFVDTPTGPSFADWLESGERGSGAQLTIIASYAAISEREAIALRGEALADAAMASGIIPRLIVQPSTGTEVVAVFAHDRSPEMARLLL